VSRRKRTPFHWRTLTTSSRFQRFCNHHSGGLTAARSVFYATCLPTERRRPRRLAGKRPASRATARAPRAITLPAQAQTPATQPKSLTPAARASAAQTHSVTISSKSLPAAARASAAQTHLVTISPKSLPAAARASAAQTHLVTISSKSLPAAARASAAQTHLVTISPRSLPAAARASAVQTHAVTISPKSLPPPARASATQTHSLRISAKSLTVAARAHATQAHAVISSSKSLTSEPMSSRAPARDLGGGVDHAAPSLRPLAASPRDCRAAMRCNCLPLIAVAVPRYVAKRHARRRVSALRRDTAESWSVSPFKPRCFATRYLDPRSCQ